MTVDDRRGAPGGEPRPVPPRRSTRDLERYAALFAQRTKVMTSSAMRDLMAITERPEVISLAGGLPDTSTFPPDSYAAIMRRVASESCARALQYGPTEGMQAVKACIAEVMAEEGTAVDPDDVLVTTGGQQVIDLMCKTLIDRADVPGRDPRVHLVPGRRRAGGHGRRRDADRRAGRDARPPRAGGPAAEVH